MQVNKRSIGQFLSARDVMFAIPFYQRNYNWEIDNCKQLLEDIVCIAMDPGKTHFLGTICFKTINNHERSLIDGQQRITSITLMMKALYDLSADEKTKKDIDAAFLHNYGFGIDENSTLYTKLHLNDHDDKIYRKLLNDEPLDDADSFSHIIRNYKFFKEKLVVLIAKGLTAFEVNEALENTIIVELDVENENPQEIFESLNSTGLDLTPVDLLKNYLLMSLTYDQQKYLYKNYWMKIENNVQDGSMDQFFFDYLIYKRFYTYSTNGRKASLTRGKLYYGFRRYYDTVLPKDSTFEKAEAIFKDLLDVSELYSHLLFDENTQYSKLNEFDATAYATLYINEGTSSRPVLLELYSSYRNGLLSAQSLLDAMRGVLAMVFRSRILRAVGISNQVAYNILGRIDTYSEPAYITKFWIALTAGKGKFAFPSDEEFKEALIQIDLYTGFKANGAKYLLYTLEQHGQSAKELPDYDNEKITIEHILPQNPSSWWEEHLTKFEWENRESYIHRLGNLTLTGSNSELSNSGFNDKKILYSRSSFHFTRGISRSVHWGFSDINRRSANLANICVTIWDIPKQFKKEQVHLSSEYHTFDEDPNTFSFTKPNLLMIEDETFLINSWKSMIITICNKLLEKDKSAFDTISESFKHSLFDIPNSSYCDALSDGRYVKCHFSAAKSVSWCRELLEQFDNCANTDLTNDVLFTIRSLN